MLKKLLTFLVKLFRPTVKENLTVPHPQEPQNPAQTVANTNLDSVITCWLNDWLVPVDEWDYWPDKVKVKVYDSCPAECLALGIKPETPAYTVGIDGIRQLNILASWLSPGVLAHEFAHISYALLSEDDKKSFAVTYHEIKDSEPLIKLLYSQNTYGLTSDVEAHAEIFRYLQGSIPECLKKFYPKLMEG